LFLLQFREERTLRAAHSPNLPGVLTGSTTTSTPDHTGEPWGKRLWLSLVVVALLTGVLGGYRITTWPMADDEVPTLVEMGLTQVDGTAFSVPSDQIGKLPRALPVWYAFQRFAIGLLPQNELGFRLPSLVCAVLTSALIFLVAARWRGLWYGAALAIIVNGSQPFVYLSQVNRFYSMPLLMLTLTLAAIGLPQGGVTILLVTGILTVLTVLSHNVIVVVFVLAFLAACAAYLLGRVQLQLVWRTGVSAAISVLLYFLYLRPLVNGWNSTGNPTPVLVSFAAHAGIPALVLAALGAWISLVRPNETRSMLWWALMFAGSLCFLEATSSMSWNPRYFLFFMLAMWIVAAHAMEFIARRLGYRSIGVAWYCAVAVLLLPNLLSHYQDGSRHDYRQAASVLLASAHDGQPILSDDAETISYYLPANLRQHLVVRTKVTSFPETEFFLVCRSNAWTPAPQIPHRQMTLAAEIYRRRIDQFSHILRVYRVAAANL
jgi:hypothetical protein